VQYVEDDSYTGSTPVKVLFQDGGIDWGHLGDIKPIKV